MSAPLRVVAYNFLSGGSAGAPATGRDSTRAWRPTSCSRRNAGRRRTVRGERFRVGPADTLLVGACRHAPLGQRHLCFADSRRGR
mgnify:CR=1 FL=1